MKAVRVQPSLNWEGNTGPWSSFALQIGVPAQVVTVLPATSKYNVWTVLEPEGCSYLPNLSDCEGFRGGLFAPNQSTNFNTLASDDVPYHDLPLNSELPLAYNGTAEFGFDLIGFGYPDSGGAVLEEQVISAFAYTTPWLATGLLGLTDQRLNITDAGDRYPSPLLTLQNNSRVASLFWAYNAGARYLDPKAYASLTFGGYDAGRGNPLKDGLTVSLQGDQFRDIVVSIEAVSIGQEQHALDSQVNAYIDSVVPDMWLPETVCKMFEDAFDLEWNETAEMYLLDNDHRTRLYGTDAKVIFTLADPATPSNTIDISFAYAAFDLEARYPLAGIQDDSTLQYFPLKRANDSSQYYLGHTFLQEAYLAVDYDRSEFHLSQADLLSTTSKIVVVDPPGGRGLSEGATVGIAVGVVLFVVFAASLAAWFLCRPRWQRRRNSRFRARLAAENVGLPDTQLPPPDKSHETEMEEYYAKRPLSPESDFRQELDATKTARGSVGTRAEMESPGHSATGSPRSKMSTRRQSYGFPGSPAELESRSPRMMHSRTASGSSVEPMSPLSVGGRTELERTEELHEMP